jgi:hypothetical protein
MKRSIPKPLFSDLCEHCDQPFGEHYAIGKLKNFCPLLEGASGLKFKLKRTYKPLTLKRLNEIEHASSFTPFYIHFTELREEILFLRLELEKKRRNITKNNSLHHPVFFRMRADKD